MPDFEIRGAVTGSRREGRRSLSAYGPQARGAGVSAKGCQQGGPRSASPRFPLALRSGLPEYQDGSDSSAGVALAIVYPFLGRARRRQRTEQGARAKPQSSGEGAEGMRRTPCIHSLETVTPEEAAAYLDYAGGDELNAAYALAWDRNRLDGSHAAPDEPEVHHALFLLCRARGHHPPSFDDMRVKLRSASLPSASITRIVALGRLAGATFRFGRSPRNRTGAAQRSEAARFGPSSHQTRVTRRHEFDRSRRSNFAASRGRGNAVEIRLIARCDCAYRAATESGAPQSGCRALSVAC